nr:endonuclease domain-containing protein [Pseudoflavonifractor phocaeensis]
MPYDGGLIARARKLRKEQTQWERKLWYDFLRNLPVRFQRQKAIGTYIVDFYCHKAALVIELDGGQHSEPEQQDYDRRRTDYLESLGLEVLRFSNLDISQNFDGVCQVIVCCLKKRLPP